MNLHPRGENGRTGGIIEPLIVEWIMDYCAFPKEKEKEVNERRRREGKERPMLRDAAAGVVWPSFGRGRTPILFSPRGDP